MCARSTATPILSTLGGLCRFFLAEEMKKPEYWQEKMSNKNNI
nr:MAG TPA: hypothetical protein [Caudoviricetes sp.]